MFYQCRLGRGTDDKREEMVSWIEERGARPGMNVELLPEKEYWTVLEVYHPGLDADALTELQKNNRKSLPSIKAMV